MPVLTRLKWLFCYHSVGKSLAALMRKAALFVWDPVIKIVVSLVATTRVNPVVFVSDPDYADNARVLSDFLASSHNGSNYDIVWLVKELPKERLDTVRFIVARSKKSGRLSLRGLYYAQSATVVFFTHRFPKLYRWRKSPIVVNLWHGSGYKDAVGGRKRRRSLNFDYVLVPGDLFVHAKSRFFGCSKEQVLPLGYPRYDLFQRVSPAVGSQHFSGHSLSGLIVE